MNINIPPEQMAFIEDLVESGRFASVDDAIGECVRLLNSREKLRAQIQVGVNQADGGELINHDSVFASLRQQATNSARANIGE